MIKEKKEFLDSPDGLIRGVWKNLPKEELLERLKNELTRLDMLDSPSRTELHKRYDNSNMPSPNTYLGVFDCTWAELMNMIGVEYDGRMATTQGIRRNNKGKRYAVKWADTPFLELMDIVMKEIHDKKVRTATEYAQVRDRKKTPSLPVITEKLGGWKVVKDTYEKTYGHRLGGLR